MRRQLVAVALALGVAVLAVRAQEPVATLQDPFRTGVDVIQLDVSVLDDERRPVRGLSAADFTVLEDGKPQRIVAVDGSRPVDEIATLIRGQLRAAA